MKFTLSTGPTDRAGSSQLTDIPYETETVVDHMHSSAPWQPPTEIKTSQANVLVSYA